MRRANERRGRNEGSKPTRHRSENLVCQYIKRVCEQEWKHTCGQHGSGHLQPPMWEGACALVYLRLGRGGGRPRRKGNQTASQPTARVQGADRVRPDVTMTFPEDSPSSKRLAAAVPGTRKRLLLCVRPLMSLDVLDASAKSRREPARKEDEAGRGTRQRT